ncbi:hypothetical protein AAHN97_21410 [Chitinophaga niabensis]|uniref:hypothetical protein n=1 Tax=Chitinophaga niabensis TaxID=536979 RepID=UPI0031BB236E
MERLDWGPVTPEGANLKKNEFIHVYNHDLSSTEKVDRTIRFITGRLLHYDLHLPPDPIHIIKIDARGQQIDDSTDQRIEQEIKAKYSRPEALFITIIK